MKNLLTILLTVISFTSIAQVSDFKLDSTLFAKINEYRISKGINTLIWDTVAYKAAQHHATYLYKLNNKNYPNFICTHTEREDVGMIILPEPIDRYKYYSEYRPSYVGECAGVSGAMYVKQNEDFYEKVASTILKQWQDSPPHNKGLLMENVGFGSVSSIFEDVGSLLKNKAYRTYNSFLIVRK
jgi:hypothetical protein